MASFLIKETKVCTHFYVAYLRIYVTHFYVLENNKNIHIEN